MILDKTGTLTYGRPALSDELYAPPFTREAVLPVVAAIETLQPSSAGRRHRPGRRQTAGYALPDVEWIREEAGVGLHAQVGDADGADHEPRPRGRPVRPAAQRVRPVWNASSSSTISYAATFRFHDVPRAESRGFVGHLGPKHGFTRVLLVSGDREAEVRRLADAVAITQIHAEHVAGRKGRDRAAGDRARRRRCSSATASTMRRR